MGTGKKLIRLLLVIGAIFLFFVFAEAQAQERIKLSLKNSTTIKGLLLHRFDSAGVLVKSPGEGVVQRFDYSQIRRIKVYGTPPAFKTPSSYGSSVSFYDRIYHHISLGVLFGSTDDNFSMQVINGYSISKYLDAGLGVGYDEHTHASLLPLFVEVKGHLGSRKVMPYVFTHLGHNFVVGHGGSMPAEYDTQGGLFFRAGAGYQVNFWETALTFSLAYSHQRHQREFELWDTFIQEKFFLNRVDFKIGFLF